jgi:hypothetical protein
MVPFRAKVTIYLPYHGRFTKLDLSNEFKFYSLLRFYTTHQLNVTAHNFLNPIKVHPLLIRLVKISILQFGGADVPPSLTLLEILSTRAQA